jgi:hypothetical protein
MSTRSPTNRPRYGSLNFSAFNDAITDNAPRDDGTGERIHPLRVHPRRTYVRTSAGGSRDLDMGNSALWRVRLPLDFTLFSLSLSPRGAILHRFVVRLTEP